MAKKQILNLPALGSARDFARASGLSEGTVLRHLRLGNLAGSRLGYVHLITKDQFESWTIKFNPGRRGRPRKNRRTFGANKED
jgi:hypothetical protein